MSIKDKDTIKRAHLLAFAHGEGIKSLNDVKAFIDACIEFLGAGFHPDTRFHDYVEMGTGGKRVFTKAEAKHLEKCRGKAFVIAGMNNFDIYEAGLSKVQKLLGITPEEL